MLVLVHPAALTPLDRLLTAADHALRTVGASAQASRVSPAAALPETPELTPQQRQLAGALMRVNHVGEVCAQALYQAQALNAGSARLREQMQEAAREETDHLAWTEQRLRELGARRSALNPLWYAGSFGIGWLAGRLGDATSLGFVVETERQVEAHLIAHLQRLPVEDLRSRAIVEQMQADERRHGETALAAGARPLPAPVRGVMRLVARVMTGTAHYI
jgi:3-demethoxyubiquinol 3-hydroxylase